MKVLYSQKNLGPVVEVSHLSVVVSAAQVAASAAQVAASAALLGHPTSQRLPTGYEIT